MDAITKHKMTLTLPSDVEFRMTRAFDAPAALVFRAWTEAKHSPQWYGCGMAGLTKCDVDLTVNGGYRYTMHPSGAPVGTIFGVYREIAAPDRLVFTFAWEEAGERGLETLVTVTFAEQDGKTQMTFRQAPFQSDAERDGHQGGWNSTFDRLAEQLARVKSAIGLKS